MTLSHERHVSRRLIVIRNDAIVVAVTSLMCLTKDLLHGTIATSLSLLQKIAKSFLFKSLILFIVKERREM